MAMDTAKKPLRAKQTAYDRQETACISLVAYQNNAYTTEKRILRHQ